MSDERDLLSEEVEALRRLRDELRVRLHLTRAEARDAFEALEKRWQHLEGRVAVLRDATKESAVDVRAALRLVVDELREGYERVKRLV